MEKQKTGYLILLVVILSVFMTIRGSYSASLSPDAHMYLMFAKAFSRFSYPTNHVLSIAYDDVPKDKFVVAHYSSYLMKDGRILPKTPLGYPLLLSFVLRVFGFGYVFYLNAALLSVIIVSVYLAGKEIFTEEAVGLVGVLLLFAVNYNVLDYSLILSSDITSLAFITLAFYCMTRRREGFSLLGGLLSGLSLFIRITNIPAVVLLVLYVVISSKPKTTVYFFACLILGSTPIIIQDTLTENSITLQYAYVIKELAGLVPPTSIEAVLPIEKETPLGALMSVYPLPIIIVAALGAAYAIRKKEVYALMLPSVIVYLFLFSTQSARIPEVYRYLLVIQPFMSLLASYGLIRAIKMILLKERTLTLILFILGVSLMLGDLLVNRVSANPTINYLDWVILLSAVSLLLFKYLPGDKKLMQATILLMIPLLLLPSHTKNLNPQQFQFQEAEKFSKKINENTGEKSVILTCKYLGPIVDGYSERNAIPPYVLTSVIDALDGVKAEDFKVNITRQTQKIRVLMDAGYSIYLIDNKRYNEYFGDLEDCSRIKDMLDHYFAITPKLTLDMREYRLEEECGKRYCTLYEIKLP